jgi:hypothetical protein
LCESANPFVHSIYTQVKSGSNVRHRPIFGRHEEDAGAFDGALGSGALLAQAFQLRFLRGAENQGGRGRLGITWSYHDRRTQQGFAIGTRWKLG